MLSGVWQESTGIPAGSANLPMISGARRGDFPLSVNRLHVDSSRTQAGGGTRSRPGNPLSPNLPAVVSKGPGRSWPNVNIPYQLMKDLLPRRPKRLYQRPTGISVVDPKKIAYTKVRRPKRMSPAELQRVRENVQNFYRDQIRPGWALQSPGKLGRRKYQRKSRAELIASVWGRRPQV